MAVSGGTRSDATGHGREFSTELAADGSTASGFQDFDGDGKPDAVNAAALVGVLPEVSMPYRRRLAYAGIALGFGLAFYCASKASPGTVYIIALGGLAAVLLFTLLYMDGAKTEHLTRLVEAAGIVKGVVAYAQAKSAGAGSSQFGEAPGDEDFDPDQDIHDGGELAPETHPARPFTMGFARPAAAKPEAAL